MVGLPLGINRKRRLSSAEVEATLAAIRQRVRARQGLPPDGPDEPPAEDRGALAEAMDAAHISAHFPILWNVPIIGRAIALVKRVVRLLLRWYINPIVDQQNDFNAAAVRALAELTAENERLRQEIERLRIADYGLRNTADSSDQPENTQSSRDQSAIRNPQSAIE